MEEEFSVIGFAKAAESAIDAAEDDGQNAVKDLLAEISRSSKALGIIKALEGEIPEGATLEEMILYTSDKLTILFGRVPPGFQSAIHNHMIWACICQLEGEERNVVYKKTANGKVEVVKDVTVKPGEVLCLDADAIHHIENPSFESTGRAIHVYGGDFGVVEDKRSLWSAADHQEMAFSFPLLMRESIAHMHKNGNEIGLQQIGKRMPKLKGVIDEVTQGK